MHVLVWNSSALVLSIALLVLRPGFLRAGEALFPFVLPWNDASPGITDLSAWLRAPAGGQGWVQAGLDGHFYAGQERIRFFGVNLSFSGGMPEKADAEGVAGRLAKFGVNVVRFHHMDTSPWPNGLRSRGARGTGELEAEALDRLCWFLARLKERGIYANLNLLVGRPFNAGDGLPVEIESMDWKDRHVVGFFDDRHMELQKEYARRLLTRVNPYTKLALGADPAVAFVEINNENGLIHAWLGNQVDALPDVFGQVLRTRWNDWLKSKYETTARIRRAWGVKAEPLGSDLLFNGDFKEGLKGWTLERHQGAEATLVAKSDQAVPCLQIKVAKPGSADWHVQLNQGGFGTGSGRPQTLAFRARSFPARTINIAVSQAHEPWGNLGLSATASLTGQWRVFRFVFNGSHDDDRARVVFSRLGAAGSMVELAEVSLRSGGVVGLKEVESVEDQSLEVFSKQNFGERTPEAQRDWIQFLSETEERYWQSMAWFLKTNLKVRALVTGTIMGCTPAHLAAPMDWVDTHAYWQHPRFPGRPWDPADWVVENRSMVDTLDNTLPRLALKRIAGKPHAVTEYNHAAPNTYGSEGFLLLAAYGALQDWDALYVYSYAHARGQGWDARRIPSFFDIDQHPAKMATLPAAAAMFLRGDVGAAQREVAADLGRDRELDWLRHAGAWNLVDAGTAGVARQTVFQHRVSLVTEGRPRPPDSLPPSPSGTERDRVVSDTGELIWDLTVPGRGVVTVNTPRTRAVIGHGGGRHFELGGIRIEPGATLQGDWSVITLTAMDPGLVAGSGFNSSAREGLRPRRWLITATGYADNLGMQWKNQEKSTVGRDWGEGPSRIEGVPFAIAFPATKVKAWSLDERGQRRESLPVELAQARAIVQGGPRWRTLWYEVEVEVAP